jgi:hypothetical protein
MTRWIALIACLAAMAPLLAGAQAPFGPADKAAVRAVIEDQLAAFQRDDAAAAFDHAAPAIKTMFETPERFMAMVRQGYQPVYRPRHVAFGDFAMLDGRPTQIVRIIGPDAQPVTAHYLMERQADGSWLIGGCVLIAEPGAAA